MSRLKEMLFKPRWMHKDGAIRAAAVGQEDDPRLLEALPGLAADDPDPQVRLQAVRRLSDPLLLLSLAQSESDPAISSWLNRTLRQMMAGQFKPDPEETVKLSLFSGLADAELAQWMVTHAADTTLRQAALKLVERESLLGDVAINDPDPQLRQQAAGRIQTEATLTRVARQARRKDKRIFRLVSERLQQQRLESGDQTVIREIAESLCAEAENLVRSDDRAADKANQLQTIEHRWQGLNHPPDDVSARFLSACRIIQTSLVRPEDDPEAALRAEIARFAAESRARLSDPDPSALQNLIEQGEKLLQRATTVQTRALLESALKPVIESRDHLIAEQQPSDALMALCERAEKSQKKKPDERTLTDMRARWQTEWNAMSSHRPADQLVKKRFDSALQQMANALANRAEKATAAAAQLPAQLEALEKHLEAGDLAASASALRAAADTLKAVPNADMDSKHRLNELRGKVHELRDWQHWSNNKMRQRLVERATELAGSGLHPDALTERLKQLNGRWKELDQNEHLPGDPPGRAGNPRLFRQFRAACDAAFEPAKAFFEKRSQVREHHQEEIQSLCETLAGTSDEDDIAVLEQRVRDGRKALRKLSEVPPRQRAGLARQLREQSDRIDGLLDEHYGQVERRKTALIAEVTELIEEPDLDKALNAAKDAQRRWKAAGRTRRGRDQKLWKQYRSAADQVFARLDAQRDAVNSERKQQRADLDRLLAEARALADLPLEAARDGLRNIRQQISAVGGKGRADDQALAQIEDALSARQKDERRAEEARLRQARRALGALCLAQEQRLLNAEPVQADQLRAALSHCEPQPPEGLAQRTRVLLEDETPSAETLSGQLEVALALCIEMEFLAGCTTPDAFADQRMAYQVKRLSERMAGEQSQSARDEAEQLECRWLACGPLPTDQAEALNQRFFAALTVFEQSS